MTNVNWIKITTDIFDDEKIQCIETMPEHDSIIVIWFKLLTLAGKSNNNGVFMMANKIPYTDEMLAAVFRRPITTVRLALKIFEQFKMIEIVDGIVTLPNWEKHQNIDGLEKIRENNRKRVAKCREKQKKLLQQSIEEKNKKTENVMDCNVTGNITVTACNALDIREREDIDIYLKDTATVSKKLNNSAGTDKPSTPEEKTTISCSEKLDNSTEKDKSSTPEVKKTKSKNSKSLLFDKINEFTQDEKLRSILNDYLKFKLSHSRGYDIKQWVMQLDALRGFSKGDTETAYRQVALAYSSGWQSLVYLDNNKKTAYKPKDVNAFEALEKEHEMNYDDNNNDGIPIF